MSLARFRGPKKCPDLKADPPEGPSSDPAQGGVPLLAGTRRLAFSGPNSPRWGSRGDPGRGRLGLSKASSPVPGMCYNKGRGQFMGNSDESLRSTRLVFYKEDIEIIGKSPQHLPQERERPVRPPRRQGRPPGDEGRRILDLRHGHHLRPGRRILRGHQADGQAPRARRSSRIMFHQGKKDNIQLSLVGERTILAVIFDDRTTLGMVRLYASQVSSKLAQGLRRDRRAKERRREDLAGVRPGRQGQARRHLRQLRRDVRPGARLRGSEAGRLPQESGRGKLFLFSSRTWLGLPR